MADVRARAALLFSQVALFRVARGPGGPGGGAADGASRIKAQQGATRPNKAQQGPTRPNKAQQGATWRNKAQQGTIKGATRRAKDARRRQKRRIEARQGGMLLRPARHRLRACVAREREIIAPLRHLVIGCAHVCEGRGSRVTRAGRAPLPRAPAQYTAISRTKPH